VGSAVSGRHRAVRRRRFALVFLVALVALPAVGPSAEIAHAAGCSLSRVACENQLPGDPTSDWFVNGAGDPSIQGFATSMSVNAASTI
jgi:hypothetical protein